MDEVQRVMNKNILRLVSLTIIVIPWEMAFGYGHANRWGGSSAHTYGASSHTNAYGGSTTHAYGEGTSHTSAYGTSTPHSAYGGPTHTHAYGGTTTGEARYGAVHTPAHRTTTHASTYPPPRAYFRYRCPPATTAGHY